MNAKGIAIIFTCLLVSLSFSGCVITDKPVYALAEAVCTGAGIFDCDYVIGHTSNLENAKEICNEYYTIPDVVSGATAQKRVTETDNPTVFRTVGFECIPIV